MSCLIVHEDDYGGNRMGKMATKKAVKQVQKLYEFLQKKGGLIKTKNPGTWWDLDFEIQDESDDEMDIFVGICQSVNGDIMFDPAFDIRVTLDEKKKMSDVEILHYTSDTFLGTCTIDEDDMMYGFGMKEKDAYGLKKRFSSFMDNMVENGPYLKDPESVTIYED